MATTQVTTDVIADGAITAAKINTGGALAGFRNRIINGGMMIDQRNAGAAQTFTAGAALSYCVDRWYGYSTGANVTGQQVAGSNKARNRYQFTGAASVTGIGFGQRIEAANSYDLNGRTCTLAVDLANSLLTTVNWTAYYANSADTFGSLASPTRTSIATGSFTVNSTVSRYYASISIPSAATTGIEVVFSVGAQTSGTFIIGDVDLAPTSASEPWHEQRHIGIELALCQRYYEKSYNQSVKAGTISSLGQISWVNYSSSSANFFIRFSVNKRAAPTVTLYSPSAGTSGNIDANGVAAATISSSIGEIGCSTSLSGSAGFSGIGMHFTAESEL